MGLFDFFKRNKQETNADIAHTNPNLTASESISNDEYQRKRQMETEWLERHYDLNSAKGIASIPERDNLPRPTFGDGGGFRSYTGDIDYYLRQKSAEYEKVGNTELAILCLRKSNAIRMICRRGYRKDDYYTLVRLLARSGYIKEAETEKCKIDAFFGRHSVDSLQLNGRAIANKTIKEAYELGTRLLIMQAHGYACSECAKYQGRVFSIYGKDPRFPPLPEVFYEFGCIHEGCSHSFFPYIDGISDPGLEYTLSVHRISSRRYAKNIVAFSNRPFVDDRPQEDIDEANQHIEEARIAAEKKKYAEDHMIEREARQGVLKREYKWIQDNLLGICPKSFSGYSRMKNANTKNYQKIVAEAARLGYEIK